MLNWGVLIRFKPFNAQPKLSYSVIINQLLFYDNVIKNHQNLVKIAIFETIFPKTVSQAVWDIHSWNKNRMLKIEQPKQRCIQFFIKNNEGFVTIRQSTKIENSSFFTKCCDKVYWIIYIYILMLRKIEHSITNILL